MELPLVTWYHYAKPTTATVPHSSPSSPSTWGTVFFQLPSSPPAVLPSVLVVLVLVGGLTRRLAPPPLAHPSSDLLLLLLWWVVCFRPDFTCILCGCGGYSIRTASDPSNSTVMGDRGEVGVHSLQHDNGQQSPLCKTPASHFAPYPAAAWPC